MNTVISVENLGKRYTLRHQQRESYTALRDVLANGASSIGRRILHLFRKPSTDQQTQEEFWALKDVSFEVKQGDRIGIIGRNGAGKSTLLKILSRITEPTSGRVKIKGRVASLLEVGTGFHPELTGRENIYLNGAILGMGHVEIRKKFDEIVDFAEIEKFLDTPVKRYSSGMYVRLAFAVAAHLEPDILVVDEVLAVGDAQFQKKCLGKMGEVAQEGRTVLFVSHNLGAIRALCTSSLLLADGQLITKTDTESALMLYLDCTSSDRRNYWECDKNLNAPLYIKQLRFINNSGEPVEYIDVSLDLYIEVTHSCSRLLVGAVVLIEVWHNGLELIHTFDTDTMPERLDNRSIGENTDYIRLPASLFKPGILTVSARSALLHANTIFHQIDSAISIELHDRIENTTFKGFSEKRAGLLRYSPLWNTQNPFDSCLMPETNNA